MADQQNGTGNSVLTDGIPDDGVEFGGRGESLGTKGLGAESLGENGDECDRHRWLQLHYPNGIPTGTRLRVHSFRARCGVQIHRLSSIGVR